MLAHMAFVLAKLPYCLSQQTLRGRSQEAGASAQEKVLTVLTSQQLSAATCSPQLLPPLMPCIATYLLANNFRYHVWHEPDGELADHFPGDHSLGPGT